MIILYALLSGIISAMFSVLFQVRLRHLPTAGLGGAIGYIVYQLVSPYGGSLALLAASAAITLYAEICARKAKAPATVYLISGILPIVPGGGLYQSMLLALEGRSGSAGALAYRTLLNAGAIAVGIILVSAILRVFSRRRGKRKKAAIAAEE